MPRSLRIIGTQLLFALLLGYFLFHFASGDSGVMTMLKLNRSLENAQEELAGYRAERQALEARVAMLTGPEIDADLLDEQAKRYLGYRNEREVIIMFRTDLDPASDSTAYTR